MERKTDQRTVIFFFLSCFIFWGFGYQTVWQFLNIDIAGVVITSKDVPSRGAPRYVTEYVVRSSDGQDHAYVAGATDASLPRSMPVGTQIKKERGSLYYERNGEWFSFPFTFYTIVLTGAFCCFVYALAGTLSLWRSM
jgi:hypothetical protein